MRIQFGKTPFISREQAYSFHYTALDMAQLIIDFFLSCSNLGPYREPLDLHIFTIKKHHIRLAGKVSLPLPTMQRNKPIEGWFEMQPPEYAIKKGHIDTLGEINMRALVKEDISLPYKAYSTLGSVGRSQETFIQENTFSLPPDSASLCRYWRKMQTRLQF